MNVAPRHWECSDKFTPKPLHIGSVTVDPPVLQAPMAGFTDFAYRQTVRRYGRVGLPATEMVSARGLDWLGRHRGDLPERLWGVMEEPRPLAVQIWDNDPETLARVGRQLARELKVSVVDINFGCPVARVSGRAQSGSYLLKDPDRIGTIVQQVVAACRPTPVTAKIRLGCTRNSINAVEVARAVESAGAAALTVHGRTADDFFRGSADWHQIARIKPHLHNIPLIGNGDLTTPQQVVRAFTQFGVDGVMIGRAALGRPWLFMQVAAALRGEPIPPDPPPAERRECLLQHYELLLQRYGEEKGTMLMRKQACKYAHGSPGARQFRACVAQLHRKAEFVEAVRLFFPKDPVA